MKRFKELSRTFNVQIAQRPQLKRVFNIDIVICQQCGGAVKVIACIEDPAVIKKILEHLEQRPVATAYHPARAPPTPPPFLTTNVTTPAFLDIQVSGDSLNRGCVTVSATSQVI